VGWADDKSATTRCTSAERRSNQSSGGRRGPLVAPASYEHFPPSHADSVFTRRRTVRARAFVMPHIAHRSLLRRISGIAHRVLAIILCSRLIHARIPALGLRSIVSCAFPLPAVAACPGILHLSSGSAERSDRKDEQQDKPSHDASEGGHALLKRGQAARTIRYRLRFLARVPPFVGTGAHPMVALSIFFIFRRITPSVGYSRLIRR
jgi:hypothetical protein